MSGIRIDVYHHFDPMPEGGDLAQIKRTLARMEIAMTSQFSNLEASIAAENTSIDAIAAGIAAEVALITQLQEQIAGGLSADEATQVNADLTASLAKLTAIQTTLDPAVPPAA